MEKIPTEAAVFLAISTIAILWLAFQLYKTRKMFRKYNGIINIEGHMTALHAQAIKLSKKYEVLKKRYIELKNATDRLEDEHEINSFGLYEPKYNFETAQKYKEMVHNIRNKQKEMIRNKEAAYCTVNWPIDGSSAKGRKATEKHLKLALHAFNVECDNLILKATYRNVSSTNNKIVRLHKRIEDFLEPKQAHINIGYLQLKVDELIIVHEFNEKTRRENEEQNAIKAKMREEERARKEYEAAQKTAEEEKTRYEEALAGARSELINSKDSSSVKLYSKIKELEAKLKDAEIKNERAVSMAQQTSRGFVSIVSNIGSFGEDVYKIGLTRRLEPLDRIKELGNASVPFAFDVHAMIFSEDAPSLETTLHRQFDSKRINKANKRKEFFKVGLDEIESFCSRNDINIQLTKMADAREYYETLTIEATQEREIHSRKNLDDREHGIDLDIDLNVA